MDTLFLPFFKGPSWDSWRAFLGAIFALPVPEASADIVRRCTGRESLPVKPAREAWMVVGRRGGKSRIAAFLAIYMACFRRYTLAGGERGIVQIVAADRKQAKVILRYVLALIEGVPMLATMVENSTQERIDLANGISVVVHTASFKSVRGYTVVGAVLDEIAFWPTDDAANPDHEIVAALRPAMATIPEALLLCLSSPYARRGELWRAYDGHFGRDGDPVLVWQADTRTMNPSVPQEFIDAEYTRDPVSASAEYGAKFRTDVESFVSRELVKACVMPGRLALPPEPGFRYVASWDQAGGAGQDSATGAIAHRAADGRVVLDALFEHRPPFSPTAVIGEFAALMAQYSVRTVSGDRWAGLFPSDAFARHRIVYEPCGLSKSQIYAELLPLLSSGRVDLLDNERLIGQLLGLERRTARGGRDSYDHQPGPSHHDDLINAAAIAIFLASGLRPAQASITFGRTCSAGSNRDKHDVSGRLGIN
jgi:hypothetical protein